MSRRRAKHVVVLGLLVATAAMLAGALALQIGSGRVRVASLAPAVLALALVVLGSVLLLHRPRLRIGPLLVVNGVVFAAGSLAAGALDYGALHPLPLALERAAFALVWLTACFNAAWTLFILWFPDGFFTSRAWRRFFVVAVAVTTTFAIAGWVAGSADRVQGFYAGTSVPPGAAGPLAGSAPFLTSLAAATLLFPVVALAAMVQRYRRATPVVRQQIRWLVAAIAVDVIAQIAAAPLVDQPGVTGSIADVVAVASTPLPVVAAGVAMLRYRLWDIDLVISRALVYGALWALLSALLVVPGFTAGLLLGGRGALAAVALALLVTVVFQPVRTRLERVVNRFVYRHRAAPYELLRGFWVTLRTARLERMGSLLEEALTERLGASWGGLWLYSATPSGGRLRPLSSADPPLAVAPSLARELAASPGLVLAAEPPALAAAWPAPPAAIVPLVAGDELMGLLACGERRGDPFGAADFALIELLARQTALRLRNLRLEAELRERLAEIEAQADALLQSRRRIVAAQDDERRRIERNLHDGVQQQLVALAVRLRQAGAAGEPLLQDLADEAEQAVFSLQELARGIFPSVLADQGLPAALRAQAGRLPLTVRVEIDPALLGRRLDAELEAAVYFVALEALTNVQKHAAAATASVWLRQESGEVVLEVADDGPGATSGLRGGSGLQNMDDRMAAVGGQFTFETAPGHGTRLVARAPWRAATSPGAGFAQIDQDGRDAPVHVGLGG